MYDAQLLMHNTTNESPPTKVFSPWMPRGGDNMLFTLDVPAIESGSLVATVYHKNEEDTGDGATTGTSVTATSDGRSSTTKVEGLKEMVRFEFSFDTTSGSESWVIFRMLPTVWYDEI